MAIQTIKYKDWFINQKYIPTEEIDGQEKTDKFWNNQRDLCVNGFWLGGVYFPGYLYWHLNVWHTMVDGATDVHGKPTQEYINPIFRDNEWLIFNSIYLGEATGKGVNIFGARRISKDLLNSSLLYTPQGEITIGSCKVGQEIYDDKGNLTTIKGVYPQGIRPVYKITLQDGRELFCGLDHNWSVIEKTGTSEYPYKEVVKTTKEIMEGGVGTQMYNVGVKYWVRNSVGVPYSYKDLPSDPYIKGLYLGEERITEIYLRSSRKQRLSLLQGLMDSEKGFLKNKEEICFSTTNEKLADDFCFLVRSIGIAAKKEVNKDNFEVTLYTDKPVFRLKKELNIVTTENKEKIKKTGILSIEYVFDAETTCIEVDNPQKLFLTDNFTITHNTTTLASYFGHGGTFDSKSQNIIAGLDSTDIKLLTDALDEGLNSIPEPWQWQRFGTWEKQITLGVEDDKRKRYPFSRYMIRNLDGGNKQERIAGTKPRKLLIDEALWEEEKVLRADKTWIPIKNIHVGDKIYDHTGGLTTVLRKIDVGERDLYTFTLKDGKKISSCDNHNWKVHNNISQKDELLKTKIIRENYIPGEKSPFLIPYLLDGVTVYQPINHINKKGRYQAYCIEVDNEEHLFLTTNNIITGNCGKGFFLKGLAAALPGFTTATGLLACSPLVFGTSGDVIVAEDAKKLFEAPKAMDFLAFPNEENPENPTGLFLGAKYRLEAKEEWKFGTYLQENRNDPLISMVSKINWDKFDIEELNKITILVSNEEKAFKITDEKVEQRRLAGDIELYLKEKMYYPKTRADIFLKNSTNFYNKDAITARQKRIKAQNIRGIPVELYHDGEHIRWKKSDKMIITEYPVKTQSKDAPIAIFEFPSDELPPWGLYTAGCLLPGSMVLTDKGLKKVEAVTLKDKLVNKDGKFVKIKNLQTRFKIKEDSYLIGVSGSSRKTAFTKEHPIYSTRPTLNKNGRIKVNKKGEFDLKPFDFIQAKDLKVGDIIKYPNIYNRENNKLDKYWVDFKIKNPLYNEDFWWLVGLFLGDGYCCKNKYNNYKNYVSINIKEDFIQKKAISVIKNIFNRSPQISERGGCNEIAFNSNTFGEFFTNNFGKYAEGKHISEWVKYIPKKYRANIILGYLDSDGCVIHNKRKDLYNLDFVSTSLDLMEGIQDLFLGLGITSNINVLREAGEHTITSKVSKTKKTYQLRTSSYNTELFLSLFNNSSYKGKLIRINPTIKKINKDQRRGFWFEGGTDYLYVTINSIETRKYSGAVYNFECETNTFLSRFITTHNCDPYRMTGDSKYSTSLGALIIYKRTKNITGDGWRNTVVATYAARPEDKDVWNEQARLLIKFYNAYTLVENDEYSFIDYMKQKGDAARYLAPQPAWLKVITPYTTQNRAFGVSRSGRATREYLDGITKKELDEVIHKEYGEDGSVTLEVLGVTKHSDTMLLEEIKLYEDGVNADRYVAYQLALALARDLDNSEGANRDDKDKQVMSDIYAQRKKVSQKKVFKRKPINTLLRRKKL